jgi:membrane-associated phospholipid phosphatase
LKQQPTRPARAPQAVGNIGWQHAIVQRVGTHTLLKAASTVIAITLFFAAYFWVLRHPIGDITTMPVLALDRWLAFEFAAVPLYLSLWVYVSLGPALLLERRALLGYGVACAAIAAIGLTLFLIWPTKVPPLSAAVAAEVAAHAGMAMLRGVDMSGNACPSLHVAFAVFAAAGLARELRAIGAPGWLRVLNGLWCTGIVYSTLAIRQHVVLDVLAGALLGATVALLHAGWERSSVRRAAPAAALPIRVRSAVGEP